MPPASAPRNLPMLAIRMTASVKPSSAGSSRVRRSMPRPATAKNTGLKKAMMKPRSWLSICSVRIGDWPIRMPATKAPRALCTPISSVVSAIVSMMSRMALITGTSVVEVVVAPDDDARHRAPAHGEADGQEQRREPDAHADMLEVHRTVGGDAGDDGDDDPGQAVVEDGGGQDELAEVAPDGADLHQHHGDDLDRRDGQRRAEEERGHQARRARGDQLCRQRIGQGHAADERHRDAEQRCRDHRPALAVHQSEVGLHAGQQQQEQNTDLRDGIDHALERRRFGKNQVPQLRQHGAEDRGAEQHARQQLAEDRRLADAGHALADQPAEKQQQDQLGREDRRRVVSCHACLRLR